jgi:hypothetical protein
MALSILDGNQSATTLSTLLTSGQHITAHTVVSLGTQAITDMRGAVSGSVVSISNLPSTQPVSIASVTVGNTVTIAGTVTANPTGTQTIAGTVTASVNDASLLAALNLYAVDGQDFPVSIKSTSFDIPISGTVTIGAGTSQIGSVTASISGTVPISISSVTVGNSVTIGSLPAISGTVTANSSNGSLTTRFGSVTTANTAFATSAVTNANRKYLLIQNVTTASNVITVGIGFTPTTTQGIQLSSGAGLTFEGSYIPTGAVNLLSSVTASCFTILEA